MGKGVSGVQPTDADPTQCRRRTPRHTPWTRSGIEMSSMSIISQDCIKSYVYDCYHDIDKNIKTIARARSKKKLPHRKPRKLHREIEKERKEYNPTEPLLLRLRPVPKIESNEFCYWFENKDEVIRSCGCYLCSMLWLGNVKYIEKGRSDNCDE
jgi:hypothetical protein